MDFDFEITPGIQADADQIDAFLETQIDAAIKMSIDENGSGRVSPSITAISMVSMISQMEPAKQAQLFKNMIYLYAAAMERLVAHHVGRTETTSQDLPPDPWA